MIKDTVKSRDDNYMETSTFWLICLKILFVYAWKVEYFYYERVQWKDSVKQRRQPLLMKQRRQPSCSFSFSHVNQHQHLRFWFKSFWSESQVTIFRIMFTFIYVFQILEKAAAMWITLQRVVVMCLIYGLLVVLQLCLRFSSYVYLYASVWDHLVAAPMMKIVVVDTASKSLGSPVSFAVLLGIIESQTQ